MTFFLFVILSSFLLLFSIATGQVHTTGRYQPKEEHVSQVVYTIKPPFLSNKHFEDYNSSGPFQFAKAIPVSIHFTKNETVFKNDYLVWKIKIQSSGALSLSLIFDRFWLPEQAELWVHNEHSILGAFKAYPSNKKSGKFSTTPIIGDSIFVSYFSPLQSPPPILHIHRVVYGYKSLAFLEQKEEEQQVYGSHRDQQLPIHAFMKSRHSGRCNIDILCDSDGMDWSNEARAVAVLLTNENQVYCTGVLINNVEYNGRQLLLTAYHCVSEDPETDIVMFNHQRKSCSGYKSHSTSLDTLHGLKWLAGSDISDYALLEIEERIPSRFNVYLAGWTTIGQPLSPLIGIHHPSGDFKKLSVYNGDLIPACWSECPYQKHWKVSKWTRGTTEPGSSGSPLFDATHRIVGQLHGGSAACWNKNGYDIYGSFNASWVRGLAPFLDPNNLNVMSMNGIFLNQLREEQEEE